MSVTPTGKSGATQRSAARLAAVQALYQIELSGTPVTRVIDEFLQTRLGSVAENEIHRDADRDLFSDVVQGFQGRQVEIDGLIGGCLDKDRTLARLEAVQRALLRAGTYELLARPDVPARVVINEYVNVAHAFFAGAEPGFANGVLDQLARRLRPGEIDGAGSGRTRPAR